MIDRPHIVRFDAPDRRQLQDGVGLPRVEIEAPDLIETPGIRHETFMDLFQRETGAGELRVRGHAVRLCFAGLTHLSVESASQPARAEHQFGGHSRHGAALPVISLRPSLTCRVGGAVAFPINPDLRSSVGTPISKVKLSCVRDGAE